MTAPDATASELRQALDEVARLQRIIALKDEQIRLLNFRFFGPKSEKLSPEQIQLLFQEVIVLAAEVEQEAERSRSQKQVPQSRKPRQNHPGREKLPEHLERRE